MDMARGGGYQDVCQVLEQFTKEETELTQVRQQLWFVNNCTIGVVSLVATTMT